MLELDAGVGGGETPVDAALAGVPLGFPSGRLLGEARAAVDPSVQALARQEGAPLSAEFRRRHGLPAPSSVQKALATLEREELVARVEGRMRIVEPFLREWILAQ